MPSAPPRIQPPIMSVDNLRKGITTTTFSTRNPFYLRISQNIVLPIYVYLDERHVNWMSDKVLQHVLSDLRPFILPKLKAEADNLTGGSSAQKKATVDTYRGDTYQFCYFIRKTEPHSVVIKTRNFRAAPPKKVEALQASSSKKRGKRKEPTSSTTSKNKKRRRNEPQNDDDDYEDVTMNGEPSDNEEDNSIPLELEIEEEEEKPKPILSLKYQGFSIYGQCLCVVVEPWPVMRAMTLAPVFAPAAAIGVSSSHAGSTRAQTPLFLPEDPEESEIGNRSNINQPYLNQILKDVDASDDEDDMGGMLEFSQVLHNIGDTRAGATNDDDDMDGSILFGDADERREL